MLLLSDIKKIAFGAIEICNEEEDFRFFRFENSARENYKLVGLSTASVMLDFITDSETLFFDYKCTRRVDRAHCFFDIYENNVLIGHTGKICEKEEVSLSGHYETKLSKGEKRIRIYFPNLYEGRISRFCLDEGASVKRSEKRGSILMMGDSITHGYDAYFPSLSYANTVARELDLDMTNQAIGGEMFRTSSLPETTSLTPDYVTVAYGTNDWSWSGKTLSECRDNAISYFEKLEKLYPASRIIYISPLYRGDNSRITSLGSFDEAVGCFTEVARGFGADIIDGVKLIPHDSAVFEDKYLHPNDLGFTQYAKALIAELALLGVK